MNKREITKIETYVKGQLNENADNLKVLVLKNGIVLKVIANWEVQCVSWKLYDWNFSVEGEGIMYFSETTDELWVGKTMFSIMGGILASYHNFYMLSLKNAYEEGRAMYLPNGEVVAPDKAFSNNWVKKVKELCPQIWGWD